MTKKDSLAPKIYGVVSVFFLSFINMVNLITIFHLIKLNRKFFKNNLPDNIIEFFTDFELYIKISLALILIINNIVLYKHAKKIKITYDKFRSSLYVFIYFITSMLAWFIVMVETVIH